VYTVAHTSRKRWRLLRPPPGIVVRPVGVINTGTGRVFIIISSGRVDDTDDRNRSRFENPENENGSVYVPAGSPGRTFPSFPTTNFGNDRRRIENITQPRLSAVRVPSTTISSIRFAPSSSRRLDVRSVSMPSLTRRRGRTKHRAEYTVNRIRDVNISTNISPNSLSGHVFGGPT